MFSYIDPSIVDLLLREDKLRHLDREGRSLPPEAQDQRYLSLLGPVPLPMALGDGAEAPFDWYAFVRHSELGLIREVSDRVRRDETRDLVPLLSTYMQVSSVLVHGLEAFATAEAPVVRVHSCCMTSDVFGSRRCECGPQLHAAFRQAVDEGTGAVVYMSSHEGRGIGLWAKAVTYLLQDLGQDTYEANTALGLPEDSRDFTDAAVVLRALRPQRSKIRLLTNNPLKVEDLTRGGIDVVERVPLVVGFGEYNLRYMQAKREKGHEIPLSALGDPARPDARAAPPPAPEAAGTPTPGAAPPPAPETAGTPDRATEAAPTEPDYPEPTAQPPTSSAPDPEPDAAPAPAPRATPRTKTKR